MASKQATVDFLVEQIHLPGTVRSKKMFGEYAIYCEEKLVAFVCDDQLFIKPTDAGRAFIGQPEGAPPYPGAKDWFLISEEKWDDDEWLTELIRTSLPELPIPKKKPHKK